MAMNTEIILTCAVTGGADTVGKHPAIPLHAPPDCRRGHRVGQRRRGRRPHPRARPRDRGSRTGSGVLPAGRQLRAREQRRCPHQPDHRYGRRVLPRRGRPRGGRSGDRLRFAGRARGARRGAEAPHLQPRLRQHELLRQRGDEHPSTSARSWPSAFATPAPSRRSRSSTWARSGRPSSSSPKGSSSVLPCSSSAWAFPGGSRRTPGRWP